MDDKDSAEKGPVAAEAGLFEDDSVAEEGLKVEGPAAEESWSTFTFSLPRFSGSSAGGGAMMYTSNFFQEFVGSTQVFVMLLLRWTYGK
eukprot:6209737-Pleurochrysis_carterae.AAC.2